MPRLLYALALVLALGAVGPSPGLAHPDRPAAPAKKRVAPVPVAPVTVGPLRYEARYKGPREAKPGAYVAIVEAATNELLREVRIYAVCYDLGKETDVQDVLIRKLSLERRLPTGTPRRLLIEDERGRRWALSLSSDRVERL